MTRQRGLVAVCGVLCSLALAVLLFRGDEPVRAASANDRSFPDKSAIKVVTKNQSFEYLTWPKAERMGGRVFVGGYRVNSNASVWLPLDDVVLIEEYSSLEEMVKAYPGLAPKKDAPARPDETAKAVPTTEPKKN